MLGVFEAVGVGGGGRPKPTASRSNVNVSSVVVSFCCLVKYMMSVV